MHRERCRRQTASAARWFPNPHDSCLNEPVRAWVDEGGLQTWLPVALGAGVIAYSLLTDYELGLVKTIPMPVHLGLDIAGGLLLAASPWLFGFAEEARMPHLILGLFEIVAAVVTRTTPARGPDTGVRQSV